MKALVVDDSSTSRRIVGGILRHECNFEKIKEASDGEEALELLGVETFDLVLLDWTMPKMEGIEVLKRVRATGNKVPIIMVTAIREKTQVLAAFAAGANNYIVKPISPPNVTRKVAQTLEHLGSRAAHPRTLSALIVDDSIVVRRILAGTLCDRCGFEKVVEAEDGQQAVQAAQASKFDLILLDWNMPNMLGIDALRTIRSKDRATPIVMVTSENEATRVVEAFDAGANNYIIKPFEPATIAEKVQQVLHLSPPKKDS